MAIKPTGHHVIVKPDPVEEYSEGGIKLVTNERAEKAARIRGTIVSVGPYAWADDPEPWAKEGDYVYYAKYAGKQITDPSKDDEELVLCLDVDILAVIEDD